MDKPKSMTTPDAVSVPSVFADPQSQMTLAERAAMEGILRELQPALSIELGTAKGASLRRIAAHSGEVHAFDLTLGVIPDEFPNVRFHIGDSHVLLRQVLADFEREARTVDFALVDGDHSVTGVRQDLDDLLSSSAVSGTVILLHDCLNEGIREGISQVRIESDPRIRYVDLNFVPPSQEAPRRT